MPRIKLRGITKRFGKIVAVEDINLVVEDGEYVTLLGPSGCGKTTLVKIISGIWDPTEGEVFVDGEKVNGIPVEERNLGYVFQDIVLFPHMNVWSNATYSPLVRALTPRERERIGEEVLQLVDLLEKRGLFPAQLSGGAQQQVGLARALASKTNLLILDEPLSALDARVRVELRYELKRLVKDLGLTAIHVTHDQEEASSLSDRIVVMKKGRIVEVGTPEQLYSQPKNLFSANFVGEMNLLEGTIRRLMEKWASVELRNQEFLRIEETRYSPGSPVILAIRPENLSLDYVERGEKGNALIGYVQTVRFMGAFYRFEVLLRSDDIVLVDSFEREDFEEGDMAVVRFDEKRVLTYPRPYEGLMEVIKLE